MKIETIGTAPSGHNIINFRVGANELEILRGLLTVALKHTPETSDTAKTVQRMRAMVRCLNSAPVAQWIEHGDSTSTVAGSNPAGGATLDDALQALTASLSYDECRFRRIRFLCFGEVPEGRDATDSEALKAALEHDEEKSGEYFRKLRDAALGFPENDLAHAPGANE